MFGSVLASIGDDQVEPDIAAITALDTVVLTAYGFSAKKDLLAQP